MPGEGSDALCVEPAEPSDDGPPQHAWTRACLASRIVYAQPDWSGAGDLDALLAAAAPAVEDGFAALLLGFDRRADGLLADEEVAQEAVALRVLEAFGEAEVHLVCAPDGLAERCAAARAVDAVILPWSCQRLGALDGLVQPVLRDADAVERWRSGCEGEERESAQRRVG